MAIETTKTWRCDICGTREKEENNTPPKGWVAFSTESLMVDRDFIDHHVCDHCTGIITTRAKSAG